MLYFCVSVACPEAANLQNGQEKYL